MAGIKFEIGDIILWPMLRNIEPEQWKEVEKFFVYNYGSSLMLLTKSGRLYDCPQIITIKSSLSTPTFRIEESNEVNVGGDKVIQIENFGIILQILTEPGNLYFLGSTERTKRERLCAIPARLVKRGIRLVRCGTNHMLALAFDGSVYAWGNNDKNQLGLGLEEAGRKHGVWTLTLVESLSKLEVVDLHCEEFVSMAVTRSGQIYVWGGSWHSSTPTLLYVPQDLIFYQVSLLSAPGSIRILAITNDGQCYLISPPQFSSKPQVIIVDQKGQSTYDNQTRVKYSSHLSFMDTKIPFRTPLEPISNIATSVGSSIAVLQSTTGQIYLLDPVLNLVKPIDSVTSVADVFALYGSSHDIHRLISVPDGLALPESTTFNNSNSDYHNLKIRVKNHKQMIYVKYSTLRERVPKFARHIKPKDLNTEKVLKLPNFKVLTYQVVLSFLRYTLNREIWIRLEWAIDLYHMARTFEVANLRDECESFFRDQNPGELMYALGSNLNWIDYPSFVDIIEPHFKPANCIKWYSLFYALQESFPQCRGNNLLWKLEYDIVCFFHRNIDQVVRLDSSYPTMPVNLWFELFFYATYNISEESFSDSAKATSFRKHSTLTDDLSDYYCYCYSTKKTGEKESL